MHAFIMFMTQRTKERAEEKAYREYVTDSLQNIPQNKYINRRFADLLVPHENIDVQATIDHVINQLGMEVTDEPS